MRLSRPKPDLLVLEHGPWSALVGIFAVVVLLVVWSFNTGFETGLLVSLGCASYAWFAARRFERLRVVFDADAGRVEIRRRTGRYGSGAASYGLAEIGSVESDVTGSGKTTKFQLILVIPTGPNAGRHPLNAFEIPDRSGPELALEINSWLKQNR